MIAFGFRLNPPQVSYALLPRSRRSHCHSREAGCAGRLQSGNRIMDLRVWGDCEVGIETGRKGGQISQL